MPVQAPTVPKGTSLKTSVVQHIQAMFRPDIFSVPKNATNTIYVEGIPVDASEREVSRKWSRCSSKIANDSGAFCHW